MAIMPPEVQELFTSVPNVTFSTATTDGQPNTCIVGMKKIIDDETVYMSDQFFKKTLANLQANPKVAITFWEGGKAYQLHGTATYINEGAQFEEQAAWVNAAFEGIFTLKNSKDMQLMLRTPSELQGLRFDFSNDNA